jgi:hypothetical protein
VTGREGVSLRSMVRAGGRALATYTGTALGVFAVQVVFTGIAFFAIMQVLAAVFAHRPLFDDAVDGDLVALLECIRHAAQATRAMFWIGLGAIFLWVVTSWFLIGGIYAVVAERPEGKRDTARIFGAGGAATFFVYLRLAVVALALHILVLGVLLFGLGAGAARAATAMSAFEFVAPLAIGAVPGFLLLLVVWTAIDYARCELAARRPTHGELGAVRALIRGFVFIARRPVSLAHGALGWLAFIAVSIGFAWAAQGHAMMGTSGAIALVVIRLGVALVRSAIKFAMLAGHLELTETRPPPPRRVVEPAA